MAPRPKDPQALTGERLELRYVPLEQVVLWEENPKQHDEALICQLIETNGFVDPGKYDATLGAMVYGNGRSYVLQGMRRAGRPRPRGILEDASGAWYVPVNFGVDAESLAAARRFAIDHNNSTMLGGDFGPEDLARMWAPEQYQRVLDSLAEDGELPVTFGADSYDAIFGEHSEEAEHPKDTSPQLPGLLYSVVITCDGEDEQGALLERFRAEGLKCKPLIS